VAAADREEWVDRLARPMREFARHKLAGAGLLLLATLLALLWANSPLAGIYESILGAVLTVKLEGFGLEKPLLLWINDGLMGIFFFVVGLEIKRELLAGELASPRKAMLPIAAAVGGMLVPAALYAALNAGEVGAPGWGIPMATDIAFALGVLALLGDRVPPGLKVFLTALAIVDDIGAILVIAIFYTETVALGSLAVGGFFFALSILANAIGVRSAIVYFLLGTGGVWLAFMKSGVHATLAAVLMAMTIPASTRIAGRPLLDRVRALSDALRGSGLQRGRSLPTAEQHHLLAELEESVEQAQAPLQRLEHALVPVVTFLVLPVFALANAGVAVGAELGDALRHPVAAGIVLGLFVGKPLGIVLFSALAVRLGWADLPSGVGWTQVLGVGALAGIGFTMALFIGSLAFDDPALRDVAKVGILSASTLSAVVGVALLRVSARKT